jgi:small neutral amino acid transporter SnatA (MarC family)
MNIEYFSLLDLMAPVVVQYSYKNRLKTLLTNQASLIVSLTMGILYAGNLVLNIFKIQYYVFGT